jgi:putative membrane protein
MKIGFRTLGSLAATCLFVAGFRLVAADERKGDDAKPLTDQEFIARVIDANLTEVNLSNLAGKSASDEEVKKFAQHLIDDHKMMNQKALELANAKKVAVASGLNPKQREAMATLSRLSGKDFDRKFVDTMVMDHEEVMKMFERCQKDTKDEAVKKLCEEALPTVRDHLKEARSLQEKLGSKK